MTPEARTPDAIRIALEDLLRSDGWAILCEMVEDQFGDAALVRQFNVSLASLRAADRAEQGESFAIIQAGSNGARAVLALPESKLRSVTEQKPAAQMFDRFRRVPRHA